MRQKTFFGVTGVIFLAIAVLHLLRLINSWEAQIAGWGVPLWLSFVALVVSGFLSYTAFKLKT